MWGTKRLWPWGAEQSPLMGMAGGQKVMGAHEGKRRPSMQTTLSLVTPHCSS